MDGAEAGDFVGVGGDEDVVELGAGAGGFVDPGEHGAAGDGAKDFAGEAGGGEARGYDSEDGDGALFRGGGIKYDWGCWCRGEVPLSIWADVVMLPGLRCRIAVLEPIPAGHPKAV